MAKRKKPTDHILVKLTTPSRKNPRPLAFYVFRTPNNEIVSKSKIFYPKGTTRQSIRSCVKSAVGICDRNPGIDIRCSKEVEDFLAGS